MKTIPFNLNNTIHVYLDERGEEILRKHFNSNNIEIFRSDKIDGYYQFQCWAFIDIFGGTSCGSYAPFSCKTYIEVNE